MPIARNEASKGTSNAPIVIFAYNRPDRIAALFESLKACDGFEDSPVVVYLDGPRDSADELAVGQVRDYVENIDLPNVQHVASDHNKGLRNSVYAGVSQVVSEHGRAIVLEDDLVVSPTTLSYFNRALDFYADDPRVWSVSAYIYDIPELRDFPRALILPYASSWGWATWQRAWSRFELDAHPREENLLSDSFRQTFELNGIYPARSLLRLSLAGQLDSWAIHWWYTIMRHGGRSVYPPRRVIGNHGLSNGTHGSRLNPHQLLVRSPPPLLDRLPAFESADEIDYFAADLMKQCWELKVQRFIARAGHLKRKLPYLRKHA